MKKSYLSVAFATCAFMGAFSWLAASAQPALAQGQPIQSPVYVIDIAYIFKHDPNLKTKMDEMQVEVANSQKEFNRETDQLKKDAEILSQYQPGTPDYHNAEEGLVKRKADIGARIQLRKKELAIKESRIYYNAYIVIKQECGVLCQQNRVPLVLTFNREEANPENPDDVMRLMNSKSVWNDPQIDVTLFVLNRLSPVRPGAADNRGMQGVNFPQR